MQYHQINVVTRFVFYFWVNIADTIALIVSTAVRMKILLRELEIGKRCNPLKELDT